MDLVGDGTYGTKVASVTPFDLNPNPNLDADSDSGQDPHIDHNQRAWDGMAKRQERFARPISDDEFDATLRTLDAIGWLGPLKGKRILCLAAGGGRQGPVYAAAGAEVTVVDLSPAQLALDREVAARRQLHLRTIQTTMNQLGMLASQSFDIVVQPVSTCYVPEVGTTFHEVGRILVPHGIYISQHKQPASLQAETEGTPRGYTVSTPYQSGFPLPAVVGSWHREPGTREYLHTWQELLGGMCRAGFVIEDLVEPDHARDDEPGTFGHRSQFLPPYVRIKARRKGSGLILLQ